MYCPVYESAYFASCQLLLDSGTTELPVKPVQLAARYGVECKSTDAFLTAGEPGKLIYRASGKTQIVVSPDLQNVQKRFVVLHELGHYFLGECEYTADHFAACVLMPQVVLLAAGIIDPESISIVCGVSSCAAVRCSKLLTWRLIQGNFIRNDLERKLFIQFNDFIHKQKR